MRKLRGILHWGRCPQAPGILPPYRQNHRRCFAIGGWRPQPPARFCGREAALAASRDSDRWVGAQVASLRCLILRPGIPRVDDNSLAVQ